jgi:hypothetical protein
VIIHRAASAQLIIHAEKNNNWKTKLLRITRDVQLYESNENNYVYLGLV